MLQAGNFATRNGHIVKIKGRVNHATLCARIGQNLAPRGNDERIPIGLTPAFNCADRASRNYEGAILNRQRSVRHMPICLSGFFGKGGRDQQNLGPGLCHIVL